MIYAELNLEWGYNMELYELLIIYSIIFWSVVVFKSMLKGEQLCTA